MKIDLKFIKQKRYDKDKIYSLHENHIYVIAKGKDHKQYEFGTKASIVTTKDTNIILGVVSHEKNEHDSKTIESALIHAQTNIAKAIKEAICDRGYRGVKKVTIQKDETNIDIAISIPGTYRKKDTRYEKKKKEEKFKRRASIEPVIGHMKHNYGLSKNYLKGFIGDQINLLLSTTAWNLKKWINIYFFEIFLYNYTLFLKALIQLKTTFNQYLRLLVLKVLFEKS